MLDNITQKDLSTVDVNRNRETGRFASDSDASELVVAEVKGFNKEALSYIASQLYTLVWESADGPWEELDEEVQGGYIYTVTTTLNVAKLVKKNGVAQVKKDSVSLNQARGLE